MTQRADLDVRLQAAVAERDEALARRLADQLVHRRGLEALQTLLEGALLRFQGEEAVAWLEALVRPSPPAEPPASDERSDPEPLPAPAIQLPPGINLSHAAATPAPAPASLAALRSWLPGGEGPELPEPLPHDLPEAC